jgi:hypothetical protein
VDSGSWGGREPGLLAVVQDHGHRMAAVGHGADRAPAPVDQHLLIAFRAQLT